MQKLLIITGPTATGKTDLALMLAKKLNGEIVSCDSRQLYKGLDVGTGKMPSDEVSIEKKKDHWIVDGINVWMYDVINPKNRYTAADYLKKTKIIIKSICSKGKLPIICGGTGLYLKVLLEGLSFSGTSNKRHDLEKLSLDELQLEVQKIVPNKWKDLNNSDRKNPRRLIRVLEIADMLSNSNKKEIKGVAKEYSTLQIGLTAAKETLNHKIISRLEKRLLEGMIEEANQLHQNGLSFQRMTVLGLEYKYLAFFLEGKITTVTELKNILGNKICQYAKRQLTWFKKQSNIIWFTIDKKDFITNVENTVLDWYNIK